MSNLWFANYIKKRLNNDLACYISALHLIQKKIIYPLQTNRLHKKQSYFYWMDMFILPATLMFGFSAFGTFH